MKLKNSLFSTAIFALTCGALIAQEAPKAPKSELSKWSVGINVGPMLSHGDVRVYDFYPVTERNNEWGLGYGLTITRSFNHIFAAQIQLLNGKVAGTTRKPITALGIPPSHFKADVFEYAFNAVINLSNLTLKQTTKPRRFALYATIGVGLSHFQTQLWRLRDNLRIGEYGYGSRPGTKNRTVEVVVPVGLGLKYKLNSKFDIGVGTSVRYLNSDKLDVVTDSESKDKYSYTDVSLTYKFGETANANQWTNPLDVLYADNAMIKSKIEGLTGDQDKDGVSDLFDKDNNTPDGVKVYGDGTTVDTDGDGVPDLKDSDPFSQKGAKVDAKGKEVDTDNDGVPDSRDLEAATAAGALVNFQGKTINVSAIQSGGEVSSTGYLPSIYFATGSSLIQYKYYENMAAIAKVLKSNSGVKLTIVGHTDETGSDKINEALGQKRADAVADHLVRVYGIAKGRLVTQSKGKSEPMAKGADGINRRVDFKVSK